MLETDGKWESTGKEWELIYKEKADSEDGYLGMYLFLMGKYLEKTESTDLPESWKMESACIKKDSKPDAGWNYTGLRRKIQQFI